MRPALEVCLVRHRATALTARRRRLRDLLVRRRRRNRRRRHIRRGFRWG